MRRILLLLCGIMFIPVLCYPQHLVEVGKGYSCTSVNTTVFRNNSLITHGDEQYISYYDAEGYLVLGKRKTEFGTVDIAPYTISWKCERCS